VIAVDTSVIIAIVRGEPEASAFAKSRDLPLLFKGNDFAKTDLAPAWQP
jgi:uncharacterized protein with PIN domain